MENQPSTARIALKWGLISGLAAIIISTAMYMTELWKSSAASLFPIAVLAVFLVLAMKEFRSENGGFMTYNEGLGLGVLLGAVSALLGSVFSQLYQKVIDPTFMDKMKDFQYEKMEEQGLGEEQIEQAMEMTAKFTSGGIAFVFTLIMGILIALILSLVIAAILKKNKPVF